MPKFSSIAFVASSGTPAEDACARLSGRYDHTDPEKADVIVALGGDGFMLQTLHQYMQRDVPIYGMNQGTVGFLMNDYTEDNLLDRLEAAELAVLHPLRMKAQTEDGREQIALAINEVSLFRQTRQAAKLRISVNERVRVDELICDGILLATPAGSTAYNLSIHGPILPLEANTLALTPISAFRPRRWRGALLPRNATVRFDVVEGDKRPVSATADADEVRRVVSVEVREAPDIALKLLFDPGHGLEERILREQFLT